MAEQIDLMKPVYPEVMDLLHGLYEDSGELLFVASEIQTVLDRYEKKVTA